MLVLSRKQDDKIVFPHLGITVEILKIAGRSVRVGVQAPDDVRVLRHELAEQEDFKVSETPRPSGLSDHALRNRLNRATLGLQLAQKQLEFDQVARADETMARVLAEFESLDEELGRQRPVRTPESTRQALLVEDDENESELLAGFLRLSGFEVDTAADGCDALDYLDRAVQARYCTARYADASLRWPGDDLGDSSQSAVPGFKSLCRKWQSAC